MTLQHRPIYPSSLKARFASRFLRALKNMKKNDRLITATSTPSSTRDLSRKSHQIKIASYTSMASAVGSKRAWTRAILQKVRNYRTAKRGLIRKRRIIISTNHALRRRKKKGGGGDQRKRNPSPKKENSDDDEFGAELRKLVPGGETMDMCKLLDETAHYVQCLATQVEVMRNMVNFYSK